jgi:hypothetical protein
VFVLRSGIPWKMIFSAVFGQKDRALGAIVAVEDREWHFLMMIPRFSRVTVQYN